MAANTPIFTPLPTETLTPTLTFIPTPILSEAEGCAQPLTPENETDFPTAEKVIFSWTEMPNAASYILNITMPSKDIVTFESEETEITRYIEAFTQGGEYKWNVTTLNATGEEICSSDFFVFTKPETPQTPENKTQGDGGGESTCEGWGCGTGGGGEE